MPEQPKDKKPLSLFEFVAGAQARLTRFERHELFERNGRPATNLSEDEWWERFNDWDLLAEEDFDG